MWNNDVECKIADKIDTGPDNEISDFYSLL